MALSVEMPRDLHPHSADTARPPATAFAALVRRRRALIATCSLAAIGLYLAQVSLSVFTSVLDGFAWGAFTWGWLMSFAQLFAPLVILHVYQAASKRLDQQAETIEEAAR